MATLLLVEHDNNQLNAVTRNAVSAARELGGEVTLLVAGENCRPVAEQAARIAGVAKVLLADDSAFKHQLAENVAALTLRSAGIIAICSPSPAQTGKTSCRAWRPSPTSRKSPT